MGLIETILGYSKQADYLFLFIIYLIEGPLANLISAFIAGKGILNIWYVFGLAASAEAIADVVYFTIGYLVKGGKISKIIDRTEKNSRVFREIKTFMKDSPFLMILLLKSFGPISIPGLLYIGQEGMEWKTFLKYAVPLSILRNAIISFVGYRLITSLDFFISSYSVYKTGVTIFAIVLLLLVIFMFGRESFQERIMRFVKNKRVK